jgi:hypothetical protein
MHVDVPQTYCLGAAARRDITPPAGIYHRMWGAATHDRSTGIHRPLAATALALSPDGDRGGPSAAAAAQVVVAVDHCLFWSDEMAALRAAVARAAGLKVNQLHVALSHTHAAGLMDRDRGHLPGGELIEPYLELLRQRIAEAVGEALETLRPVRIVYGQGRSALAAHRDFWDAEKGLFACGFNPAAPADDTVAVARVADEKSRTVATVVNYACHPTTLAWDNTLVSPDYVGAMREVVEAATGGVCVFMQGASGDLGPREGYVGDVEVADRNGRALGYAALAALEALGPPGTRFEYTGPVISGATLGTWAYRPLAAEELRDKHRWQCASLDVALPYRPDLPKREETETQLAHWQREELAAAAVGDAAKARDCRAQAERMTRALARLRTLPPGPRVPLEVTAWRLGDAFWVFVSGEHYNLLQRTLREKFPKHPILVATVTDGWLPGYVPTAETFGKGIYQESIAAVAPSSLEKLIDSLAAQLAKWDA